MKFHGIIHSNPIILFCLVSCFAQSDCPLGYTGESCNYKQKNKETAFWLSFILGAFGADRFYLGYIGLGIFKLICGIFLWTQLCFALPFIFIPIFKCKGTCHHNIGYEFKGCCAVTSCVFNIILSNGLAITAIIWWIVDMALINSGNLPDVHGYALF